MNFKEWFYQEKNEIFEYNKDNCRVSWDACKQEVLNILSKYIKSPPYDKADGCQPVLKEIKERIEKL